MISEVISKIQVVIAKMYLVNLILILVLFLLSPVLCNPGYSKRGRTKSMIKALENALAAYEADYSAYPPSNEDNGGNIEGTIFRYRNDILVKYLDGDPSNGGGSVTYFDFPNDRLSGENKLIFLDSYGQPFWYCNFRSYTSNGESREKFIDQEDSYHPWTNCLLPKFYQIYTKANFPDSPYGGQKKHKENLCWITNYN